MTLQRDALSMANRRNYKNICRKYLLYLIPCTMTAVAESLDSFVDSIVVSNLLDSSALSITNLASPAKFVFSTIYVTLGVGGAALYSVSRGNHDRQKSDEIFSMSMIIALLAGVFLNIVGCVFAPLLAQLLGSGSGLETQLSSYLRLTSFSAIPIIVSCVFTMFLPACGHPLFATMLTLVANGINLVLDYVFIKWFNLGVNGAELATISGFVVGLTILVVLYLRKKDDIAALHFHPRVFRHFKTIFEVGFPSATTQIGYAIKIAFCNLYAAKYAGEGGVIAFAIFMQVMSMISVFLSGVFDTVLPFYGTLKGLNDRKGQLYIVRLSAAILAVVSVVFFLVLQLWPKVLLNMFAIDSFDVSEIVINAVRIFSWLLLIRWVYLLLRNILSILGMKWYPLIISLTDGFLLPILFSVILCPIIGIDGLWWALLVSSVVILVAVFIKNKIIAASSNGKYKGFWLIDVSTEMLANLTIDSDLNNISVVTHDIEQVCRINNIKMSRAMLISVSVEEMSIIIRDNTSEKNRTPIDVLIQRRDDEILVDLCSVGIPLNSMAMVPGEDFDNFEMIKRISKSVNYDYMLGMNVIRIVLSV